jgi:hypothetical protein
MIGLLLRGLVVPDAEHASSPGGPSTASSNSSSCTSELPTLLVTLIRCCWLRRRNVANLWYSAATVSWGPPWIMDMLLPLCCCIGIS